MKSLNFYNRKYHVHTGFALMFLFFLCYIVPNQLEWMTATIVPEVYIDKMISFHPWWIWIYTLTYFYVAFTYLFLLNHSNSKLFVNSFVFICLIGSVIFFFYPTTFSRELYPINPQFDLSSYLLHQIRLIDKPKNCVPSFHIAMTVSTSASLYLQGRSRKVLAVILGLLIGYSTMAVKQHYFLDVFTGLLLGASIFYAVFLIDQKEK